ncbi:hypothetical protein CRUP_003799 [Coryphaenoides rupestris]|nr:hypothetical protein CRUP_003799 [Coryphaenoides rupestris]
MSSIGHSPLGNTQTGQTVELVEKPSERPGWYLVRTTDRSPPQEGLQSKDRTEADRPARPSLSRPTPTACDTHCPPRHASASPPAPTRQQAFGRTRRERDASRPEENASQGHATPTRDEDPARRPDRRRRPGCSKPARTSRQVLTHAPDSRQGAQSRTHTQQTVRPERETGESRERDSREANHVTRASRVTRDRARTIEHASQHRRATEETSSGETQRKRQPGLQGIRGLWNPDRETGAAIDGGTAGDLEDENRLNASDGRGTGSTRLRAEHRASQPCGIRHARRQADLEETTSRCGYERDRLTHSDDEKHGDGSASGTTRCTTPSDERHPHHSLRHSQGRTSLSHRATHDSRLCRHTRTHCNHSADDRRPARRLRGRRHRCSTSATTRPRLVRITHQAGEPRFSHLDHETPTRLRYRR